MTYFVAFTNHLGGRSSTRFDSLAEAIRFARSARRNIDSGAAVQDTADGSVVWPSAAQVAAGYAN